MVDVGHISCSLGLESHVSCKRINNTGRPAELAKKEEQSESVFSVAPEFFHFTPLAHA